MRRSGWLPARFTMIPCRTGCMAAGTLTIDAESVARDRGDSFSPDSLRDSNVAQVLMSSGVVSPLAASQALRQFGHPRRWRAALSPGGDADYRRRISSASISRTPPAIPPDKAGHVARHDPTHKAVHDHRLVIGGRVELLGVKAIGRPAPSSITQRRRPGQPAGTHLPSPG